MSAVVAGYDALQAFLAEQLDAAGDDPHRQRRVVAAASVALLESIRAEFNRRIDRRLSQFRELGLCADPSATPDLVQTYDLLWHRIQLDCTGPDGIEPEDCSCVRHEASRAFRDRFGHTFVIEMALDHVLCIELHEECASPAEDVVEKILRKMRDLVVDEDAQDQIAAEALRRLRAH